MIFSARSEQDYIAEYQASQECSAFCQRLSEFGMVPGVDFRVSTPVFTEDGKMLQWEFSFASPDFLMLAKLISS